MPPRRAPIRIFPSTLVTNTHRAEGIFKLLARGTQQDGADGAAAGPAGVSSSSSLREPSPSISSASTAAGGPARALTVSTRRTPATATLVPSRRGAAAQQQQQQPAAKQEPVQQPEQPQQPDRRRSSRCNGEKIDDWIRIPVEASVLVESGTWELLEGIVFLSPHTGQLWKRNDLAIFEATYKGSCYNYLVPEGQLPMMTVDHPEYKAEAAKIEVARRRKLGRISEMIRLSKGNAEAEHGWELHAIAAAHAAELEHAKAELQRAMDPEQAGPPSTEAPSAASAPAVSEAATTPTPTPAPAPGPVETSAEEALSVAAAAAAPAEAAAAPADSAAAPADSAAAAPAAASSAAEARERKAVKAILDAIGATITSTSQGAATKKLALDEVMAQLKEHPLVRARRKRARGEPGPTGAGSLDAGGVGASFSSSSSSSSSGNGSNLGLGRLPSDPSLSSAGGSLSRSGGSAVLDGIAEEEDEEESEGELLASDDADDDGDEAGEGGGYRDIVDIFTTRLLQTERPKPAHRKKKRRKWGRGRPWTK